MKSVYCKVFFGKGVFWDAVSATTVLNVLWEAKLIVMAGARWSVEKGNTAIAGALTIGIIRLVLRKMARRGV